MTFDELYAEYADRVYAFLRFKVRDVYLVEDVFQDTFLSAYRELLQGRQPERPQAWLLSIAHRRLVDRLRKMPANESPLPLNENAPADTNSLESFFLQELIGKLDELSRTILYALYVEGLTIKETAELTGIPEGTVKSRCHSAKAKLSKWRKGDLAHGR